MSIFYHNFSIFIQFKVSPNLNKLNSIYPKCFVPSFIKFGQVVLEKMKMWKIYNHNNKEKNPDFDQKSLNLAI